MATSFAELERWGPAYDRFVDRFRDHALFYRLGWLRAIWPIFSRQPSQLFFIGAWDGDELIGLAPFQLLQKGLLQGKRRALHIFGTHHPTVANRLPDFLIARDDRRRDCLQAFAETLRQHRDRWDLMELLYLPADSPNLPIIQELWPGATLQDDCAPSTRILFDQGYEAYAATLSRNTRQDLRRNRRKLDKNEAVYAFHTTDHLPPERWSAIARMHSRRQRKLREQGRSRYSIFDDPAETEAMQNAFRWTEQQGLARHYWLDIDHQTAAFTLGFQCGRTYHSYFIGLDERAERYHGGMLLLAYRIETEATEYGVDCLDFGIGMNLNKRRFGNQVRQNVHLLQPNRDSLLSMTRHHWVRLAKSIQSLPQMGPIPGRAAPKPPAATEDGARSG